MCTRDRAFIMEDCAKDYEDLTLQEKNMLSQVRFLAKDRGFLISNIHQMCIRDRAIAEPEILPEYGM